LPPRTFFALAIVAICLVTSVRVVATHHVFSPTYDEPLHVTAGWEFIAEHRYRTGTDNPPLARAFFAWPLRNAHPAAPEGLERAGEIFESGGDYMRGVVAARRGNLIFVALAIIGTALFALELFESTSIAIIAAAAFAMLPPILAHGGLSTTDVAGTAGVAFALAALPRFLKDSSWRNTTLLGFGVAMLLLTKFTFALYFVVAAIVFVIAHRRVDVRRALIASAIALAAVYSAYLSAHAAPRFLLGIANVLRLSSHGHDAYLFGEVSHTGWWYYFPIVLGIKTPIAFLTLAISGAALTVARKQHRAVTAIAAAILLAAMTSKADLGIRHILPIFIPLSALAAFAIREAWRSRARWPAVGLCAWLIAGSFLAHPDYLPWMNALAGEHPERIVVDSNLDWGQDVVRLRDLCRARHIDRIAIELFGTADTRRIGMPPTTTIDPFRAAAGWFAISESIILPAQARDRRAYAWLSDARAFERVGKSIRLYRVGVTRTRP
jgi:hypothetical protein